MDSQNFEQLTKRLLVSMGIEASLQESKEITEQLRARIEQIVVEVLVKNLSTEQKADLAKLLEDKPKGWEDKIAIMAAEIPGLWQIIEEKVDLEIKLLEDILKQD